MAPNPILGGAQRHDRVHEHMALNPHTHGAQRSEYSAFPPCGVWWEVGVPPSPVRGPVRVSGPVSPAKKSM